MNEADVTQRFSDRVENYVRYRPSYPAALIAWFREVGGLIPAWNVADIGAGTGISSKLFLDAGNDVTAIEPNAPMRAASLQFLAGYPKFHAREGRAEATGLASGSIDSISAAQAFHWFDQAAVRKEWARILRPKGLAAIYWNSRRLSGSPFLDGYEKILQSFSSEYAAVAERHADTEKMETWFGPDLVATAHFDYGQSLDFDALRGRLLSSSYTPQTGQPQHEPMIAALNKLFDATARHGRVEFSYDTRAFLGRVRG